MYYTSRKEQRDKDRGQIEVERDRSKAKWEERLRDFPNIYSYTYHCPIMSRGSSHGLSLPTSPNHQRLQISVYQQKSNKE
jgi:hypothetical protein